MPNTLFVDRLDKITLVRKSKATAKHPELRTGVIEFIKASALEEEDWYTQFATFVLGHDNEKIPEDWVDAFVEIEKAKKNYKDSAGPFAGPHNSFPISSQSHVYAAAKLVGHAANPAAVKAAIIRIARSKGYALPKSWEKGTKVKKAEFLAALKEFLLGDEEPVEKAKKPPEMHTHEHPHTSMRGYGYSHSHEHDHPGDIAPGSADHESSDVAHAHDHIAKAEGTEVEDIEALKADVAGLSKDLDAAKAEVTSTKVSLTKAEETEVAAQKVIVSLNEKIAKLEAEVAASKTAVETEVEKAKAAEAAQAKAEELLKAQSREPLVGAPVTKAAKLDVSQMKFDDAFSAVLHS